VSSSNGAPLLPGEHVLLTVQVLGLNPGTAAGFDLSLDLHAFTPLGILPTACSLYVPIARLGRSLRERLEPVTTLKQPGITVKSSTEHSVTATGQRMFHFVGALGEFATISFDRGLDLQVLAFSGRPARSSLALSTNRLSG
jgi:hypothetical protein